MKIYRIAKNFPSVLTRDQMLSFIMDNHLQSWGGELDLNDAKEIASYSDKWELREVPMSNFDWSMKPIKKKEFIPPIIGHSKDEGYNVLDGMHRIGEARYRGETSILAYVGEFFGDTQEQQGLNKKASNGVRLWLDDERDPSNPIIMSKFGSSSSITLKFQFLRGYF